MHLVVQTGESCGVAEGRVVPGTRVVGGLLPTQHIVALNVSPKRGGVQSRSGDPTICSSVGRRGIRSRDASDCRGRMTAYYS